MISHGSFSQIGAAQVSFNRVDRIQFIIRQGRKFILLNEILLCGFNDIISFFINDIFEYLAIFIDNFEKGFLNNVLNKELYIIKNQDDKKIFINKMYLSEIQIRKNEKYTLCLEKNETCFIDDLD